MNLNEYINFLTKEVGWKKSDIQRRARSLRDEGLIGTEYSTHGRHARQIEVWDCCYLIIAILADGSSSTVAPKAREIANTKITTDRKYCLDPLMDLEDFKSTNTDITFIDALCKIIDDIKNEKHLPAVEKISLTLNYFNPEDKNMANCRVRIDWNTPLKNKNNLSKIAYGIKEQLTELDSADQMGPIVQSFFEIENSNEIPDLPDSMKLLQSNFGISFDQLSSLNNNKVSEFGEKIINEKYLEATNDNKLFGSESLPNITNHYSIGGKILPLIAQNYTEDLLESTIENFTVKAPMREQYVRSRIMDESRIATDIAPNEITESQNFDANILSNKTMDSKRLWDRVEYLIVLDLYFKIKNKQLEDKKNTNEIITAYKLLLKRSKEENKPSRTIDSLYIRIQNFKSVDPEWTGKGLTGGAGNETKKIFDEFENNLIRLRNEVDKIYKKYGFSFTYDESKISFLKKVRRVVSANQKIKQDKRNIYLWDRDESILAWALLLENETLPPSKEDESIVNLSNLLGKIGRLKGHQIDDKYRNPTGVYLTVMNMERFKKSGLLNLNLRSNIGEVAERVWLEYSKNPQELIAKSKIIREQVEKGIYEPLN